MGTNWLISEKEERVMSCKDRCVDLLIRWDKAVKKEALARRNFTQRSWHPFYLLVG